MAKSRNLVTAPGITRFQARSAVFGTGVARKMGIRDAMRLRGMREIA